MLLANLWAGNNVPGKTDLRWIYPIPKHQPNAGRRPQVDGKIDDQIQLATNKDYTPTQHKWVTDDEGKQTKVEVAKRVKRWWTASVDGKINLVVRYGSKPLEFAKGKNSIELASETEVADTLRKVREAAELGELDVLIEQQAQFGRRLTLKNKWTNEQKNVYNSARSSSYSVRV